MSVFQKQTKNKRDLLDIHEQLFVFDKMPVVNSLMMLCGLLCAIHLVGAVISNNTDESTFVFGSTTAIRCCYTTPIGNECPNDLNRSTYYNTITDEYAGLEIYQTFILVASNMPLLIAARKSFSFKDYTRGFLIATASFVSSVFHLCKTKIGYGICLLPFCTLRALDYAFSNTVLVSTILFVLPICVTEFDTIIHSSYGVPNTNTIAGNAFMESYVLIGFFSVVYFSMAGALLCSGRYALNFITVIIVLAIVIGIFGRTVLSVWYGITIKFDRTNIILGLFFGGVAIIPFVIEGVLDLSSYWITHSLWHLFVTPALLFIFESRYKRPSQ